MSQQSRQILSGNDAFWLGFFGGILHWRRTWGVLGLRIWRGSGSLIFCWLKFFLGGFICLGEFGGLLFQDQIVFSSVVLEDLEKQILGGLLLLDGDGRSRRRTQNEFGF